MKISNSVLWISYEFYQKSTFFRFVLDDDEDEDEDDDEEGDDELTEEAKKQIQATVNELLEEPKAGNSGVKRRKRYPQKLTF